MWICDMAMGVLIQLGRYDWNDITNSGNPFLAVCVSLGACKTDTGVFWLELDAEYKYRYPMF